MVYSSRMQSRKLPVVVGIMVAAFFAALVASYIAYQRAYSYVANDLPAVINPVAPPPRLPQPTAAPAKPGERPQESIVLPQPWNGKERLNVLLLGIDQREGETDKAYRTDTMIVLTIDPATKEAGMLSIPRDTWVPIPGYQNPNYRINDANFLGDTFDYPGGGSALARKIVEQFLGVQIHYVVRLNFTAFENFIDRLGGVAIDVPADIYDDTYPTNDYSTEVFSITKGLHQLDGATALKYARTRHTDNDFGRARRQQQVIFAVKERLKDPQVLASLVAAAPELVQQLSASVKTDMTLDEMQQLAMLATQIDKGKIKTEVLDLRYSQYATTPDGQFVNIPDRARIAELRDTFFSSTPERTATNATSDSP